MQLEAEKRVCSQEKKAESFCLDEELERNGEGQGGRLTLRRLQNVSLSVAVVV